MRVLKILKSLSAKRKREAFFLSKNAIKEICYEGKNVEKAEKR